MRGPGVTDAMPADALDGFWLPRALRQPVLSDARWHTYRLSGGAISEDAAAPGVAVRWPELSPGGWQALLQGLRHQCAVPAEEYATRWQQALDAIRGPLLATSSAMLPQLAQATGYSLPMLAAALSQGALVSSSSLPAALSYRPTWAAAGEWQPLPALASGAGGGVRFYPARGGDRLLAAGRRGSPLFRPAPPADLALGYAAGNVPGTALLIAMLGGTANSAQPPGTPCTAVLARNSRHEPLFTPWVLSAIEEVDPELAAGLAVLLWDYDDAGLQAMLLRSAGLLVGVAGDDTLASLEVQRLRHAPGLRFHRHGHKVSFAAVSLTAGADVADAAALAALDSAMWDQNGCLSARVHFVEGDAVAYAEALAASLREMAAEMPRGTTSRRLLHRAYDAFADLSDTGELSLYSSYADDFALALDRRPWDGTRVLRSVNLCQGRVVVVRPVADLAEVARYLRLLPAASLQSLSYRVEPDRLLPLAQAAGACGVTALRPLGRAAFPQLAYSWDGLLPLDAGWLRPPGHFTTIEPE